VWGDGNVSWEDQTNLSEREARGEQLRKKKTNSESKRRKGD